jgi:UDP-glucose 4-epimerase
LNWAAFRAHNVYGEQPSVADRHRNVVGIFMNCILHGRPSPIFGDGEQTRAFTYVGDIVPAIADSISHPAARNQVFNIGADTARTVNEQGQAVSRAMGVPVAPQYLPDRNELRNS